MRTSRRRPEAPRPAYGHSKDGRDDLKQVLLSLGVSGDGGLPLRIGLRDGNRSDSVETPLAIEECLALGLEGVRGIVADSKAYSRRTLGLCLEHRDWSRHLSPAHLCRAPGTRSVGAAATRLAPVGGETRADQGTKHPDVGMGKVSCGRWRSSTATGRVAAEALRFVVVHSSQLAQQQTQAYTAAQAKEAEAVMAHVTASARPVVCV